MYVSFKLHKSWPTMSVINPCVHFKKPRQANSSMTVTRKKHTACIWNKGDIFQWVHKSSQLKHHWDIWLQRYFSLLRQDFLLLNLIMSYYYLINLFVIIVNALAVFLSPYIWFLLDIYSSYRSTNYRCPSREHFERCLKEFIHQLLRLSCQLTATNISEYILFFIL